jgi:hypothetical protein
VSDFTDQFSRGFTELLDRIGVPISFSGVDKRCIAGPIELKASLELVGRVDESSIRVDMLAADLEDIEIVPHVTTCNVDGQDMTITLLDRDPQDPCVRFYAIGDH